MATSNINLDASELSYTNREYKSIFEDLYNTIPELTNKWYTTEETDPGIVLLKLVSMFGDMLSYNLDQKVLEMFPATVQERFNAEQVFGLTGYKMPWFRSAKCKVTISNLIDTDLTIPKFVELSTTTYSGYEAISYVLINNDNKTIPGTDSEEFEAIEGTLVAPAENINLYLSGLNDWHDAYGYNVYSSEITDDMYYIPNYNIDQDHIWLVDSEGNEWELVEDIDLENTNPYCFEFRTDASGPRIRLKSGWNSNGNINFKLFYILSNGELGKISTDQVSSIETTLYTIVQTDNLDGTTKYTEVADDSYSLNNEASTNGYYPEMPNDARVNYKNYRNTVSTLITLDDFTHAINRDIRVMNARATDIQTDPDQWEGHSLKDYQIRIYVVREDSEVDNVTLVSDLLTEMHKYKNALLDVDIVLMEEYPEEDNQNHSYHYYYWQPKATLYLTKPVTSDTARLILNKVDEVLEETFSLSNIDFNEVPNYMDVIDTIKSCSSLINYVNLKDIEYFNRNEVSTDYKVNDYAITGILTENISADDFSKYYPEDDTSGSAFDFYLYGEESNKYYQDIENQSIYPGSLVIQIGDDVITDNCFGELISYKKDVLIDSSIDVEEGEPLPTTNYVDYKTGRVNFTLSYEATANMKISFELNRVNICKYNENALNSVTIAPEYLK